MFEWFSWGKSIQFVDRVKNGFVTNFYIYKNYNL